MNNYNNKNSEKEIDETGKKILKWVKEEEIFNRTINTPAAYFHYIVEFNKGSSRFVELVQPKNREDLILIGTSIKIPEDCLTKLNELNTKERTAYFKSIQWVLMFKPIDFAITPNTTNADKIEFTKRLYYDGLDKNKFMDSIREVDRYILYILIMFTALRESGEVEIPNPMFA